MKVNDDSLVFLKSISLARPEKRKQLLEIYFRFGGRVLCSIPPSYEIFLRQTKIDHYGYERGRRYYRFLLNTPIIELIRDECRHLVSFGSCIINEIQEFYEIDEDFNLSKIGVDDVILRVDGAKPIFRRAREEDFFDRDRSMMGHKIISQILIGSSRRPDVDYFPESDFCENTFSVSFDNILIEKDKLDACLLELNKLVPEPIIVKYEEWMPFGIKVINQVAEEFKKNISDGESQLTYSKRIKIEKKFRDYFDDKRINSQKMGDLIKILFDKNSKTPTGFFLLYNQSAMTLIDVVNALARFHIESRVVFRNHSILTSKKNIQPSGFEGLVEEKSRIKNELDELDGVDTEKMLDEIEKKQSCTYYMKRSINSAAHREWIHYELDLLKYQSVKHLSKTISDLIRMNS
jgi:hypothetical protein